MVASRKQTAQTAPSAIRCRAGRYRNMGKDHSRIMRILVIDAQGGGLGKQLISRIKKEIPEAFITAVGTNSAAAEAMRKAGADETATGENSVIVASRRAEIIVGPIGIVIADSMIGEVTPAMAAAVAQSPAKRILIPFCNCDNYIAGVDEFQTGHLISCAIEKLKKEM